MKTSTKRIAISLGIIGLTAIIAATYSIATNYLGKDKVTVSPCGSPKVIHFVVIEHGKVKPEHTETNRCDKLSIVNKDNVLRLVAFGQHDHHIEYDGVSEKALTLNQQLTITLDHAGNFRFHDHLHDEVQGTFTVK